MPPSPRAASGGLYGFGDFDAETAARLELEKLGVDDLCSASDSDSFESSFAVAGEAGDDDETGHDEWKDTSVPTNTTQHDTGTRCGTRSLKEESLNTSFEDDAVDRARAARTTGTTTSTTANDPIGNVRRAWQKRHAAWNARDVECVSGDVQTVLGVDGAETLRGVDGTETLRGVDGTETSVVIHDSQPREQHEWIDASASRATRAAFHEAYAEKEALFTQRKRADARNAVALECDAAKVNVAATDRRLEQQRVVALVARREVSLAPKVLIPPQTVHSPPGAGERGKGSSGERAKNAVNSRSTHGNSALAAAAAATRIQSRWRGFACRARVGRLFHGAMVTEADLSFGDSLTGVDEEFYTPPDGLDLEAEKLPEPTPAMFWPGFSESPTVRRDEEDEEDKEEDDEDDEETRTEAANGNARRTVAERVSADAASEWGFAPLCAAERAFLKHRACVQLERKRRERKVLLMDPMKRLERVLGVTGKKNEKKNGKENSSRSARGLRRGG